MSALIDILLRHRVVLCGGSGGVGKTTSAAALGIVAAEAGQRTLVMTIDPARRLADAMGLASLTAEPQAVPGVAGLSAMMLDAGDTFDGLITRFAKNEEAGQSILQNPYYQQISATVAGSREFMAMEKLQQLLGDERFDLLIVDTPPTQNALDFIDSPRRLIELLDGSGLGLIMRATNVANRLSFGLLGRSQDQFARFIEMLTGYKVVGDLNAFFRGFSEIIDTFRERAKKLQATLRSDSTAFVMVLRPETALVDASVRYVERLHLEKMRVAALIVNQVLDEGFKEPTLVLEAISEVDDPGFRSRLELCHQRWASVAQADHMEVDRASTLLDVPTVTAPRLTANVSSLADLRALARALTT